MGQGSAAIEFRLKKQLALGVNETTVASMRCPLSPLLPWYLIIMPHLLVTFRLAESHNNEHSVTCRANKVVGGRPGTSNDRCHCDRGANCHTCTLMPASDGRPKRRDCTRCRAKKYLSEGKCVERRECGNGTVPVFGGTSGRECSAPPVICVLANGTFAVEGQQPENGGRPCKCEAGVCAACSWTEEGYECTACRRRYFLHEGECVPTCPTGYAHVGVRSVGRICSASMFPCYKGIHAQTREPGCHCKKRCDVCVYRPGNKSKKTGDSECERCKPPWVMMGRRCVKECREGYKMNSVRFCILQ